MSPGTSSAAGTRASSPSRSTFACGTCMFDRASTLALAFSSCRAPSTTLSTISRPTMTPVDTWPITKLTTVTATSMMFIGLRSCCSATAHIEGGFSAAIWFGPYWDSRAPASDRLKPRSASVSIAATTRSASWANQGSRGSSCRAPRCDCVGLADHERLPAERVRP